MNNGTLKCRSFPGGLSPAIIGPEERMLFTSLKIRDVTLRNRIVVSPMCQYSCDDGFATDWHLVHLGSRAVGGAGCVIAEATAVQGCGRISPHDLGIWKDEHVGALERVARFISQQGAAPGIQVAHAGRKASVSVPWEGGHPVAETDGGWIPVAPSPIPYAPGSPVPEELSLREIAETTTSFKAAALRALAAGFKVVELHFAHGYLVHEFLSPLSNRRTDRYGGTFENRARIAREIAQGVRAVWPEGLPLFARISCTDWAEGGWDIDESVELARLLKTDGVDLVDCSAGGNIHGAGGRGAGRTLRRTRTGSAGKRGSVQALLVLSRPHSRRITSCAMARQTSLSWRASFCATRIGRCTPLQSFGRRPPGRTSTCAQRPEDQLPQPEARCSCSAPLSP